MSILKRLRHVLAVIFGSVNIRWKPPGWLTKTWGWVRQNPKPSAAAAGLAAVGIGIWIWQANREVVIPPDVVELEIEAPKLASAREDEEGNKILVPSDLRLVFSDSAAPLEMLPDADTETEKPVAGISISPNVDGEWKWINDRVLSFKPSNDWEPDRDYQIHINKRELLVDPIEFVDTNPGFSTKPFEAKIVRSSFYQNPNDADIKQVVVELKLSHGIEEAELTRRVKFEVLGDSDLFENGERLGEIKLDDFNRRAWIRSKPIRVPDEEDFVEVTIKSGLPVEIGNSKTPKDMIAKVKVPDVFSYFAVSGIGVGTHHNEDGVPDPILRMTTTGLTTDVDFEKNLELRLLPPFVEPENWPPGEAKPTGWTLDTVTDEVRGMAQLLELKALTRYEDNVPEEERASHFKQFRYNFERLEEGQQLLVTLKKDTPALGGYRLKDEFAAIRDVPVGPKELHVLGRFGGILALTGDLKLTVKSRNLPSLRYKLGRVPVEQVNHLVSQTSGDFRKPRFGHRFNETNFAHFAEETQSVFFENSFEANYNTLDLAPHVESEDPFNLNRGLFFLRVNGWDPKEEKTIKAGGDAGDQAFVLITDLGIVTKLNQDRTRDVFVQSLATGSPVEGAEVQVLGKNGIAVASVLTGPQGRASLPALDERRNDEKKPVAIVVRNGSDLSFMPLQRYQHHVSFSRFDVGGVTAATAGDLDGFVFTERGIYRPGDKIHAGVIIKPRDWEGRLEGVPIKVSVTDTRNKTVMENVISLPDSGFADFECETDYGSPTGEYKLWAYLVHEEKDGKRPDDTLLASTTVRVEEFLPDTMKVKTNVTPESGKGWVPPLNLTAAVDVQNLYGTPATERKVTGSVTAAPISFAFDDYPDYVFFDRNVKDARYHTWSAGETKTDETGKATLNLDMAAIAGATYSVRFECQAFEPDSGRSVKAFSNRVLVSPLEFAVGYKPEGELRYVPAGEKKMVNLLAVNPQLQRVDLADVAFEVRETYYVSILKEQRGGDFAYQSVKRERVVSSGTLDIAVDSGFDMTLPTDAPGEFAVQLKDADEKLLCRFGYSVVGKGNRSRSLDDNAELFVKLAKPEWRRGEEIEMSITAPFVGTGLITIERDKVYAHKFFTTDTNSSVQTIRVPDDLEGTAYVNVTFVRALDSPEIFMSPLSYAVAPFRIANDRRKLTVEVNPVEEARPGKPLRIPYKADRDCKIAIFAVDEGILQVTRFETPEPLPHFQRKRALLVNTYQILDLLMPEYRQIQEQLSAFGGGSDFHLNPFKRLTEAPVVYWSGIVDAGPDEREVVYDVPDYFDGSLRIMAVAVSRDGMGQARADTTVVSPILIDPGLLTFAAPGDAFDVSVTLANNLDEEAGDSANVSLAVEASEHLEILEAPAAATQIARGAETTLTFRAKASENLGNGTLTFRAAAGEETSVRRATLSVRPPVPFTTTVESGYTAQQTLETPTLRDLRPEFHTAQATASVLPISLTSGLDDYLAKYPHGCTEQLVSGSFVRLLLSNEADFGLTKAEVQQQIDRTCRVLRGRINSAGGFGMWYSGPTNDIDFLTIYVSHFLTEADDAGFEVPRALLKAPRQQLQKMAGVTELKHKDFRDQAYAIYVMTLADVVTTNYVLNLRDYLSKNVEDEEWMSGPTAVYLAGTYKLLKKNDEAKKLLAGYKRAVERRVEDEDDFHKPLAQDAQYLAILTKHFPDEAKALSGEDLRSLLEPVIAGDFNTLSAAYSVLALKGYSQLAEQFPMKLNIEAAVGDQLEALKVSGEKLKTAEFSRETDAIRFTAVPDEDGPSGIFYSVSEGGYDIEVPDDEIREGLEITREFLDASGNPITEAKIGEPLTVRLRLRSLKPGPITNVAIVDLLPGGFEVVRESLPAGRSKLPGIAFNEVREDRVVLFGVAPTKIQTLKYEVTPTRRGEFVVPPILADSMYDRSVRARGVGGSIVVK